MGVPAWMFWSEAGITALSESAASVLQFGPVERVQLRAV
jgi:hypothetical protein